MNIFLFDIDGTLISSGGAGKAALEEALASEFGVRELADKIPLSGRTDRAIVRDYLTVHGVDDSAANVQKMLQAYLGHLPGCLERGQGQVLPGIAALLEKLKSLDNALVGLLTGNIRAGARVKLGHFGIYDYFRLGGFGDDHYCRNDVAREALAAVHEHLNGSFQSERMWVIGDTPLDVECARAIGAKVAAVATGWHSLEELEQAEPDLLFNDLSDPRALLARCD